MKKEIPSQDALTVIADLLKTKALMEKDVWKYLKDKVEKQRDDIKQQSNLY
jgi:hypothetical protein